MAYETIVAVIDIRARADGGVHSVRLTPQDGCRARTETVLRSKPRHRAPERR